MSKKIAIAYDWMDKWGGVERILLTLHDMFPEAVFYTSYVDRDKAPWTKSLQTRASFIQSLPVIRSSRMLSFLLYPYAFESFNFNDFDLVISVTSSFAKGVITKPGTKHICYLLTPTRYLWGMSDDYMKKLPSLVSQPLLKYSRQWDYIASRRPDKIISISRTVAKRCKKYYQLESDVLYPPFDLSYWDSIKQKRLHINTRNNEKYYLVVSRLEPYKKIDLVVQAFNTLPNERLIVVGKGSLKKELVSQAKSNITFVENISDDELAGLYDHAEALIMPQEEDFGYVALEAQFFGCPVIAYNHGGTSETVIHEKSGLFFEEQTVTSLHNALERFHTISYNLKDYLAKRSNEYFSTFSRDRFELKFRSLLQ